jgi:hypothetical protein
MASKMVAVILTLVCAALLFLSLEITEMRCLGADLPKNHFTTPAAMNLPDYTPPNTCHPDIFCPFVFFHQRKTGGTGERKAFYNAAVAMQPTPGTYIACEGDPELSCDTYYTPSSPMTTPPPLFYGGHLYYPSFQKTLYRLHSPNRNTAMMNAPDPTESSNFTCFTQFRDPISRVQSCWNYRMVQYGTGVNAEVFVNTTASQMKTYLPTAMSHYGEGCLNEPMRIFSDYGDDEMIVNKLHLQDKVIAKHATRQTILRSSHCVVGVLERCNDTKAAIEHYLPFLAGSFHCGGGANQGSVSKGDLNEEQLEVLRELTKYEQLAYKAANLRLDELLNRIPASKV